MVSLSTEVAFGPLKTFEDSPFNEREEDENQEEDSGSDVEDGEEADETKRCSSNTSRDDEKVVVVVPVLSANVLVRLDMVRERHRKLANGQA